MKEHERQDRRDWLIILILILLRILVHPDHKWMGAPLRSKLEAGYQHGIPSRPEQ